MISKGNVFFGQDEIKQIFGIPNEVEIMNASVDSQGNIILNIVSANPIENFTVEAKSFNEVRRISLGELYIINKLKKEESS